MNHFPIDDSTLREVLCAALSTGGDYADIYLEHTFTGNINLQDSDVNRAAAGIDYGAGVRVVKGDHSGYAYTEEITPERLREAARTAARIADSRTAAFALPSHFTQLRTDNRYPIIHHWQEESIDRLIPYLRRLEQRLRDMESRIVRVQATLGYKTKYIAFCNSLGVCYEDVQPLGSLGVTCVIREGEVLEQAHCSRSLRMGTEMLNDALVEELAEQCVRKAQFALTATQPTGGCMPVVMAAGAGGILLHEAIGHAFEADFNRKNESIFSDRLGEKICDATICVVDDGTQMHNRGSINFDDEGVLGQKTYIVRDGVLTSYLHDRISARHYGVDPTGNGRRESFRHLPIPRMRSTYMEGGTATEEELIRAAGHGIYVQDFTNGQVQIGAGDFTFFVKSGYLIEGGRLTTPVKDINIIGNGPQALADILGVASNPVVDNSTWMCGKEGQSCPVTCGMPSVWVRELTVGGV
jgi:TldD protein